MVALVASTLTGCGGGEGSAVPTPPASPSPTSIAPPTGSAYAVVPEPGRTLGATPVPTAIDLQGYRLAVVTPDDSAASRRLLGAARAFATESGAALRVFAAQPGGDPVGAALAEAVASEPDLVVGLGEGVADVFSFETAQLLDQQFLVVGAQLAEPTENVTAVIWPGATGRGSAAGPDGVLDPATATEPRGRDALAVGVESVRRGETGIVLQLPSH
jgi:hypothetical protein